MNSSHIGLLERDADLVRAAPNDTARAGFFSVNRQRKFAGHSGWIVGDNKAGAQARQIAHRTLRDGADVMEGNRSPAQSAVTGGFARLGNIASGPHMTPKSLRHSFGIRAIRSGVPLNLVQRWLGHASMITTGIYLDALGEEEREIAARMWAAPVSAAN